MSTKYSTKATLSTKCKNFEKYKFLKNINSLKFKFSKNQNFIEF